MFKYNELSDLKDGRLVTPIKCTDDDIIICLDENGREIELEFNDFDFNKTVDERLFIVDDGEDSSDLITEPEPEEEIIPDIPDDSSNDIIQEPEPEEEIIPDIPDGDVINDSSYHENVNNSKSGWIEDSAKKIEILNMFGYDYKNLKKVNIWKDTVQ